MKNVLITGVSGGMGLATAKRLAQNGYHVIGLDIKEIDEKIDNFTFYHCNLRNIEEIENIYNQIKNNNISLDAIISMAGIYDMNSLVEISEEEFIRLFDINFFSIYRINKTFLPLLAEKGKIIMVSSELAPLDPLPFTGLYAISKSTIEKYAYSLRMELQLLGKQVIVIRPGAVETKLLDASVKSIDKFTNGTTLYKENASKFQKITNSVESKSVSPDKIAKTANKILEKKKPKYVYNINRNFLLKLLNAMPDRFQNYVLRKVLKANKKDAK